MAAAVLLGAVHFGFQRCQLLADGVISFQFGKRVIQSVLFTDADAFRFYVVDPAFELLENSQLGRGGGSQPLQVDVRLVCATNADLPALAAAGKFRADLLDRLAFDVVQLLPLRQCQQDIILLAKHFAIHMCHELSLPLVPGFTNGARYTLLGYHWPGNVCELKNVMERSIYRHGTSGSALDEIVINPFTHHELPQLGYCDAQPALPLDLKAWQKGQKKSLIEAALH